MFQNCLFYFVTDEPDWVEAFLQHYKIFDGFLARSKTSTEDVNQFQMRAEFNADIGNYYYSFLSTVGDIK